MKIRFFLALAVTFTFSNAQNDDLIQFDPEREYTQAYMDSLIASLRVAKRKMIEPLDLKLMLQSDPDLLGWSYYYFGKTVVSHRAQKFDSALYYAEKGIEHHNKEKALRDIDDQNLMMLYHFRGQTYYYTKNYYLALIDAQKALEIANINDYALKGVFSSSIADNHHLMGKDSLALKYYLEASKDLNLMSMPRVSVIIKNKIGFLYSLEGKKQKAIKTLQEAIKKGNSDTYKYGLSNSYAYLGQLYFKHQQIDSAVYFLKKSVIAHETYGIDMLDETITKKEETNLLYRTFVEVYDKNILDEADQTLINIIEIIKDEDKPSKYEQSIVLFALDILAEVYKRKRIYDEYSNILNEAIAITNGFREAQLKEDIRNLETRYQTKQKEDSIAQLEDSQQQQQTIIKQQRTITFGLGGLLLLLVGLGYLFWRHNKLKMQYEKENLEQRLLRTQMNPHFIRNALNSVSSMVRTNSSNTQPYISKLSDLFSLVLNNSREEFVSLDEEIAALRTYLDLESYSKDFAYNFNIDDAIDQEEVLIPPMLIQPLIENAIVHGFSNSEASELLIDVSISMSEKGLIKCVVIDNGAGYDERTEAVKRKYKSVSGQIIKERLTILKKKFKVDTKFSIKKLERGTRAQIYLPYLLDT